MKVYGDNEVKKIGTHFYPKDKEASQQLKDEWKLQAKPANNEGDDA